ncbi:MAG TPA: hypothetical protein VF807_10500, partial [Ktedonobacterales bacterium]
MSATLPMLACPNCRTLNPPGTRYCQRCGEAVDPTLVASLQLQYATLQDLDRRIAAGQGSNTVTVLRDEVRGRYLAERGQPAADASLPAAKAQELNFLYSYLIFLDDRVARGQGASTLQTLHDEVAARYTSERRVVPTGGIPIAQPGGLLAAYPGYPSPTPAREPFSWREFLSDQAIAIVLYLGALLALVATLTFVLSTSDAINNYVRFGVVAAVYALFALGAFELRRHERVRRVGSVFLVIFALMTPLVMLALYKLVLAQQVNGIQAVLTISALYTAIVYLFLAWRTGYSWLAYLGWISFGLGMLALGSWLELPGQYFSTLLSAAAVGMVLPTIGDSNGAAKAATVPGRIIGIATTAISALVLSGFVLGYIVTSFSSGNVGVSDSLRQGTFSGSAAFLGLALVWVAAVRRARPALAVALATFADIVAALALANVALVGSIYFGLDRASVVYVLLGTALVEFLFAQVAGRMHSPLRWAVSAVAVGLAIFATVLSLGLDEPDWARSAALGTGLLMALALTLRERVPAGLLLAGGFLLAAVGSLDATASWMGAWDGLGQLRPELGFASAHFTALTLALVALVVVVRGLPDGKRYTWPVYLTIAVSAFIASLLLFFGKTVNGFITQPSHIYQTGVIALFTILALALGRVERQPILGNLASGFFAMFLPLFLLADAPDPLVPAIVTLVLGGLTIAARLVFGRNYAFALYFASLWLTLFVSSYAAAAHRDPTWLAATSLTLAAAVSFAMAVLATFSALLERHGAAMIVPAALALLGVAYLPDAIASTVAVVAMVVMGSLAFALRKGYADIPWHAAAALGMLIVGTRLVISDPNGTALSVGLFAVGVATFGVAIQRHATPNLQGLFLAASAFYLTLAVLALPSAKGYLPAAIYAVALALVSLPLRAWAGRRWAAPLYGSALASAIVSLTRVTNLDQRTIGTLLIVYAAASLPVALIERDARINVVPVLFAAVAALVEPEILPLLGLTTGSMIVAMGVGRWRGTAWSAPWYVVAGIAAIPTVVRNGGDRGMMALVLALLAVLWYISAAVESRAALLLISLSLGAFAVLATGAWLNLDENATLLSLTALGLIYWAMQWLWGTLPGLRADHDWWYTGGYRIAFAPKAPPALPGTTEPAPAATALSPGGGTRPAGVGVHRTMAALTALFAFILAWFRPDAFTPLAN